MENIGYMCVDEKRQCRAFSFCDIAMDSFETIKVICGDEIDDERIQGYVINENNSLTWSEEKWQEYCNKVVAPNNIRSRREQECFSIVNRGDAWYRQYVNTADRQEVFNIWYKAWLKAPETGVIPSRPDWLF